MKGRSSGSKRHRSTQLALGCALAVACGGKTSAGPERDLGRGACVDRDAQDRRQGTIIACDCGDLGRGTAVCRDGLWSPCDCVSPAMDPSAAGGSGAVGGRDVIRCGNGRVERGELCDGVALAGETCDSATMGARPAGALRCTASCTLDTSRCSAGAAMGGVVGRGGSLGFGGALPTGGSSSSGGTANDQGGRGGAGGVPFDAAMSLPDASGDAATD